MLRLVQACRLVSLGVVVLAIVMTSSVARGEESKAGPETSRSASVEIGTWPTPEQPEVRLESFFLDRLAEQGIMPVDAALNARLELALAAAQSVGRVGLVDDPSSPCFQPNPPKWCIFATGMAADHRLVLVDALVENGRIEVDSWRAWRDIASNSPLVGFAPSLLRESGVKPEQSIRSLTQAFDATVGMPVPGSDLEKFCRENPGHPICVVASRGFDTAFERQLAQELAIISTLHGDKVIGDDQFSAILTSVAGQAATVSGVHDISTVAGIIIVDGLPLDAKVKAQMLREVRADRGYVGAAQIEFVKAYCETRYQKKLPWPVPKPCGMGPIIMKLERSLTLTTQLMEHGVWTQKQAIETWQELAPVLSKRGVTRPVQ